MAEHGVAGVEREPEVLAAAAGGEHPAAGEPVREVGGPGGVPAHRARVQHLDPLDRPADDVRVQAAADHLDLGKLGHGRAQPAAVGWLGRPPGATSPCFSAIAR